VGGVLITKIGSGRIERSLGADMGKAEMTILCSADDLPASIVENAEVIVTAGVRFGSGSVTQQVFRGNVDSWVPPNAGEINGQLIAFDGAKRLQDADVSGNITGDVANWIADRASTLDMGTGFAVIEKGSPVAIPQAYSLSGFRSVLDASKTLVSAFTQKYVFFSGAGEMIIFDPAKSILETPLVDFSRAISFRPITDTSKRYNRIRYTNYVGYAHDFVTYELTQTNTGANSIHASSVSSVPILEGVYDDTIDQGTYGILELSGGVQNNICLTDAQLLAFATSVSTESKRARKAFTARFNPILELASSLTFRGVQYFVASLAHNFNATSLWTTDMEIWQV
jgi:hypothetical protein